jgi:hypothetical protein
MPQEVKNPHGDPLVDGGDAECGANIEREPIAPGTAEDRNVVIVDCRVRAGELVDVLSDAGALPECWPVVDEDAHRQESTTQTVPV